MHGHHIRVICGPLMGVSVKRNGRQVAVYPSKERQIDLYERALSACASYADLLVLALYRRQVTTDGQYAVASCILADEDFITCAHQLTPVLTASEWEQLALRMPAGSTIEFQLHRMAQLTEENACAA